MLCEFKVILFYKNYLYKMCNVYGIPILYCFKFILLLVNHKLFGTIVLNIITYIFYSNVEYISKLTKN